MINLEKPAVCARNYIYIAKIGFANVTLPFKKTCPCTILPPPFSNFSDFPPLGEVVKIYSPPLRFKLCFDQSILYLLATLKIQILTEFAYCHFARTELMLLLRLDWDMLYTFLLLVAECCNHEQKMNYLSL